MKKWIAAFLCVTMLCAVGCAPTDDTIVTTTTTTTQQVVTTTTTESSAVLDDTTITVADTTIENTTTTTTKNQVTTTTTATTTIGTTTATPGTTQPTATTTQPTNTKPLVVTCYGDSITDGLGVSPSANSTVGKGLPYPAVLQQILGTGYQVQNAGDSGEKTHSIMVRQGALKVYLKEEVTFSAGSAQVLLEDGAGRGVITADGTEMQWTSPFGKDLPINAVTIAGNAYELRFSDMVWSTFTGKTYLVRKDTSEALTIPKGTEVVINTASTSKSNYCDIYLMGFNGTYTDVNDLIDQYQKMIDYRNDDNYLVIIPCFKKNTEFIQAFKNAFGDRVVDFYGYTQDKSNLERMGLKLTNQDLFNIRRGEIPRSLKYYPEDSNDPHLSATGYKVLAQAVYEQGQKINLW